MFEFSAPYRFSTAGGRPSLWAVSTQPPACLGLTLFGYRAFCLPKKTWVTKMAPSPPNLIISSQITMKLSKDILWEEVFTN